MLINLTCASSSNCLVPFEPSPDRVCARHYSSHVPSCPLLTHQTPPRLQSKGHLNDHRPPPPRFKSNTGTQTEKQVKLTLWNGEWSRWRCSWVSRQRRRTNIAHILAPRLAVYVHSVPELAATRQICAARPTPYLTPSTTSPPLCCLSVQRRSPATSTSFSFYELTYSPSLAENYNSWLLTHNDVIIDHGPHPALDAISLKTDKCNATRRTCPARRCTVCCMYSTVWRMTPTSFTV